MIWVRQCLPVLRHGLITVFTTVTRIFAAWFLLRQDSSSFPEVNFDFFNIDSDVTNAHVDVQDDHADIVRELGAASTILLKNENGALPLGKKDRSIVLIGSGAGPGKAGPNQFSDQVRCFVISPGLIF